MSAHWLLLVGGRAAFEASARRAAAALAQPAAARSPRALWRALAPSRGLTPLAVGVESGTFLLAACDYDAHATLAQRAALQLLMARPAPAAATAGGAGAPPPAPLPAFLPAFLELLPRYGAHALPRRGARRRGAAPPPTAYDHALTGLPLAPMRLPRWGFADSGAWHLLRRIDG